MPSFKKFLALNQNDATTKTYGTPMGASTTGVEAHSHYFTPFYVQRGANGIPSSGTYFYNYKK